MQDEEKTIDVGEANEQESTIDLDAPAVEESVKEEIQVEEIPVDGANPRERRQLDKVIG